MPAPEKRPDERRRSIRIDLHIPIRVAGRSESGQAVKEPAEANQVSAHGARIRTSTHFKAGSEIEVANPETGQSARYRVVWALERPQLRRWETGLELVSGEATLWGVAMSSPGPPRA